MSKGFRGRIGDADLRLLKVFRVVAECGGFAAAQVELGIGRSTISKHMADLEDRLGLTLCRRGRGGFALTEHGEALYDHAQRLLKAVDDFRTQVHGLHTDLVGTLDIGLVDHMVSDPGTPVVPALRQLAVRAPAVHLTIAVMAPDAVEMALLDGRLHVGMVPERERRQPALRYTPLYREACCLYCGEGHPLYDRAGKAEVDDLLGYDYASLGYSEGRHLADLFGERWAPVRVTATARQVEAVAILLLTGRYLGFLPRHVGAQWERDGRLRALLPERTTFATPILLAAHAGRPTTAIARAFLAELAAHT